MSNELCPSKVHHGLFSWAGATYLACVGNVWHKMANHVVRLPSEPIHPLGSGSLEKEASNPGTSALCLSLACHHGYDSDDQCGLSRYHLICCSQALSKSHNLEKGMFVSQGKVKYFFKKNIGNIGSGSRNVKLC